MHYYHWCLLAGVSHETDPAEVSRAVVAAMERYDENLVVAPYKDYFDARRIVWMAETYLANTPEERAAHDAWEQRRAQIAPRPSPLGGEHAERALREWEQANPEPLLHHLPQDWQPTPADLAQLVPHLPDWCGATGGVDATGLYVVTTSNPAGHWDWYEIGGRWDGVTAPQPCERDDVVGRNSAVAEELRRRILQWTRDGLPRLRELQREFISRYQLTHLLRPGERDYPWLVYRLPEEARDRYQVARQHLTDQIPLAQPAHSLVLPDGTWKEPGWPERELGEIPDEEWQSEARSRKAAFAEYAIAALAEHPETLVVGVDYHR